jgi:16S rRNA (cytosine1402-N4)-methyltransferase
MYHQPVLLRESVEALCIHPDGVYVDVTYGGGGHSAEILRNLDTGRLFAFDQDSDASAQVAADPRLTFIHGNFRFMRNFLLLHGISQVDGILADLGVSSHQFDVAEKGFSTRADGILDMRMDQNNPFDAAQVAGTYEVDELTRIFREFGELDHPHKFAQAIVESRQKSPIMTTFNLRDAVAHMLPRGRENKVLAQLFQAFRIEVNQELAVLDEWLQQCILCLRPEGKIAVISYHSLEDRLVKNYFKSGRADGIQEKDFFGNLLSPLMPVNRKVIMPSEEELQLNPRARSARLRIAQKIS